MASLDERLRDSKYANWLKVTYGLTRVKDGLGFVTGQIMSEFQGEIKNENNIVEPCNSDSCTSRSIKSRGADKFVCPNNVCSNFLQRIVAEHTNRNSICWKNCSVRDWPERCWEIAKAYMSPGYESTSGPESTDCAGLLQLIRNCKQFSAKMQLNAHTTDKVKLAVYIYVLYIHRCFVIIGSDHVYLAMASASFMIMC